ncbi:unnamed protein product [Rhizoctonia solani]|uniref:Mitochondrial inner membrane protease subunit 2 n=1 Tax=Rhizoctonia solani TaxID=456999 RepID=A0A8H3H6K7_9AGAM|nr:unnamed protein product [Rhizoctonia solani]
MSGRGREFLRLLWIIPPTLTFTSLVGTINVVSGSSMQPALNPEGPYQRDVVLIDRWSIVARHRYRRGDVVSLRSPLDPDLVIVKRVLALGGDTIETLPPYPDKEVRVSDGYAWVEGDEPFRSRDSNHFGPVCTPSFTPYGRINESLGTPRLDTVTYCASTVAFQATGTRSAKCENEAGAY